MFKINRKNKYKNNVPIESFISLYLVLHDLHLISYNLNFCIKVNFCSHVLNLLFNIIIAPKKLNYFYKSIISIVTLTAYHFSPIPIIEKHLIIDIPFKSKQFYRHSTISSRFCLVFGRLGSSFRYPKATIQATPKSLSSMIASFCKIVVTCFLSKPSIGQESIPI